jgi:hypothetical protein
MNEETSNDGLEKMLTDYVTVCQKIVLRNLWKNPKKLKFLIFFKDDFKTFGNNTSLK